MSFLNNVKNKLFTRRFLQIELTMLAVLTEKFWRKYFKPSYYLGEEL